MPIPYFPHSGRRPHFWKLRKEGYRELLIDHRWGLKGGYVEKRIGRSWVMQLLSRREDDYIVCRFQRRDDLWSEMTQRARQEEADEKRASFALVKQNASDVDGGSAKSDD